MGPSSYCGTAIICRIVFCCLLLLHFFIDKSWVSNGLRLKLLLFLSQLVSCWSWFCQAPNRTCPQQLLLLPQVQVSEATPGHEPCSAAVQLPLETEKSKAPRHPEAPRGSEVPRFRPPLHPSSLRTPVVSWPAAVISCHSVMFCEGDKARHKTI